VGLAASALHEREAGLGFSLKNEDLSASSQLIGGLA
jgi:hypothetical protein